MDLDLITNEKEHHEKLRIQQEQLAEQREKEYQESLKRVESELLQITTVATKLEREHKEREIVLKQTKDKQRILESTLLQMQAERHSARQEEIETRRKLMSRIQFLEKKRQTLKQKELGDIRQRMDITTKRRAEIQAAKEKITSQRNRHSQDEMSLLGKENEWQRQEMQLENEWAQIEARRIEVDRQYEKRRQELATRLVQSSTSGVPLVQDNKAIELERLRKFHAELLSNPNSTLTDIQPPKSPKPSNSRSIVHEIYKRTSIPSPTASIRMIRNREDSGLSSNTTQYSPKQRRPVAPARSPNHAPIHSAWEIAPSPETKPTEVPSSPTSPSPLDRARDNLRSFGQAIGADRLDFDDKYTCRVDLEDTSILLTYDPFTMRLYLYGTLSTSLPSDSALRVHLYERLLEWGLLGRDTAGGGFGVDTKTNRIILMSSISMANATSTALRDMIPIFASALSYWRGKILETMDTFEDGNADSTKEDTLTKYETYEIAPTHQPPPTIKPQKESVKEKIPQYRYPEIGLEVTDVVNIGGQLERLQRGVMVVQSTGNARSQGILPNDIITAVNAVNIRSLSMFQDMLSHMYTNPVLRLTIESPVRGRIVIQVVANLGNDSP